MATATRTQKRCDHRLRELVRSTQDIRCAVQYGVPPSTARGWRKAPAAEVVTIDVLKMDTIQLQQEVLQLRARIQKLTALLRGLLVVLKLPGYSLNQSSLPSRDHRQLLAPHPVLAGKLDVRPHHHSGNPARRLPGSGQPSADATD